MTEKDGKDFDESIWAALEESVQDAVEKGLPLDRVPEVVEGAILTALEESAPRIVETLVETMPRMLSDRRRRRIRFEKVLRAYWKPSLNLLYAVIVSAEESGRDFFSKHRYQPGVNRPLLDALGSLHARACRTALEVHQLLSGGFPLGALSRCRTLHEISVTSSIIGSYGTLPEHKDLPSRFMLHHHISAYKDALQYQAASPVLGHTPFTPEEMQDMLRRKNELVQKFGSDYIRDYGWAAPVFGHAPHFAELEKQAEISHLRPYYRWASHEIHSGSKGVHLNITESNGRSYMGTGPTVEGLADPGQMAMISLGQTTAHFLLEPLETPSLKAMLAVRSILLLSDRAMNAFVSAEKAVAAHSARAESRHRRFEAKRAPVRKVRVVKVAIPGQRDGEKDRSVPSASQATSRSGASTSAPQAG